MDEEEGQLLGLPPSALVNFVVFSRNAPFPAYADGFESPEEGGEEEEAQRDEGEEL